MDDIESQLLDNRVSVLRRAAPGCIPAYYDFAVVESDHVRRAGHAREFFMHAGNRGIAHHDHLHDAGLLQSEKPVTRVMRALIEGQRGKPSEPFRIEANPALPVEHGDLHPEKLPAQRPDCQRDCERPCANQSGLCDNPVLKTPHDSDGRPVFCFNPSPRRCSRCSQPSHTSPAHRACIAGRAPSISRDAFRSPPWVNRDSACASRRRS